MVGRRGDERRKRKGSRGDGGRGGEVMQGEGSRESGRIGGGWSSHSPSRA
jgi:hypothetical protein